MLILPKGVHIQLKILRSMKKAFWKDDVNDVISSRLYDASHRNVVAAAAKASSVFLRVLKGSSS